jgi:hypothetical protein
MKKMATQCAKKNKYKAQHGAQPVARNNTHSNPFLAAAFGCDALVNY